MTERELVRLDIKKINEDGRYIDLDNTFFTQLSYNDIIFLRKYHGNRNIARNYEFRNLQPLPDKNLKNTHQNATKQNAQRKQVRTSEQTQQRNTRVTSRTQTPRPTQVKRKNYAMTREGKYTNQHHKGIKPYGQRIAALFGVIVVSIGLLYGINTNTKAELPVIDTQLESEYDYNNVAGTQIPGVTFEATQPEMSEESIRMELIQELSRVYNIDYKKTYDAIARLTDNFTSDAYLKNNTIENISCKGSGQIFADSEEEILIYTMRVLKQDPQRFNYSEAYFKTQKPTEQNTNYTQIIAHYSQVLGVDPCLIYGIMQAETGWSSELFDGINNPAGLKLNNGDWWEFDTKEEGIIELMLEVLKYKRMGANSIEDIAKIHCPLNDRDDKQGLNKYWVQNVTEGYEQAQDVFRNLELDSGYKMS